MNGETIHEGEREIEEEGEQVGNDQRADVQRKEGEDSKFLHPEQKPGNNWVFVPAVDSCDTCARVDVQIGRKAPHPPRHPHGLL